MYLLLANFQLILMFDYRHFGFAMHSRAAVDDLAERANARGDLVWPPREEPFPVGYYCGLRDPTGNYVEFSYGQPLASHGQVCPSIVGGPWPATVGQSRPMHPQIMNHGTRLKYVS